MLTNEKAAEYQSRLTRVSVHSLPSRIVTSILHVAVVVDGHDVPAEDEYDILDR